MVNIEWVQAQDKLMGMSNMEGQNDTGRESWREGKRGKESESEEYDIMRH